jgi:hypothetical protein
MVSCISRVIGTDYTCKSTNHLTVISSLMVSCISRVIGTDYTDVNQPII